MSRRETRARRRRAHIEEAAIDFSRARGDAGAFKNLLDRLANSDTPLWPVAQEAASRSKPLDADELAMIAEIVAPRLAGKTPSSIRNRELKARRLKSQVSSLKPRG